MESSGSFARESMEGVKDQWVRSRGRSECISEGGVYKVNKEFVREEGDCLIVRVRSGNVIWLARQGIRGAEILPGMCVTFGPGRVECRLHSLSRVLVNSQELDPGASRDVLVAYL